MIRNMAIARIIRNGRRTRPCFSRSYDSLAREPTVSDATFLLLMVVGHQQAYARIKLFGLQYDALVKSEISCSVFYMEELLIRIMKSRFLVRKNESCTNRARESNDRDGKPKNKSKLKATCAKIHENPLCHSPLHYWRRLLKRRTSCPSVCRALRHSTLQ